MSTLRILVDRCAGTKLATWLRANGHDVVESRDLGPDPGDRELLKLARSQGRVLITIDTDFGKIVHVERAEHKGIVRLPDVPALERIRLMETVLRRYGAELESGAVVTVRGQRVRISRPLS